MLGNGSNLTVTADGGVATNDAAYLAGITNIVNDNTAAGKVAISGRVATIGTNEVAGSGTGGGNLSATNSPTSGQMLYATDTSPTNLAWGAPPSVGCYWMVGVATNTLAHNAYTKILYTNTVNLVGATYASGVVTPGRVGVMSIAASAYITGLDSGEFAVAALYKNNVQLARGPYFYSAAADAGSGVGVAWTGYNDSTTNAYDIRLYHLEGGAQPPNGAAVTEYFGGFVLP
jgi:hypothetical protein